MRTDAERQILAERLGQQIDGLRADSHAGLPNGELDERLIAILGDVPVNELPRLAEIWARKAAYHQRQADQIEEFINTSKRRR